MRTASPPKYLALLLALAETLPKGGGVFEITVLHDDSCPRLKSPRGVCNCEPELAPMEGSS